MQGVNRRGLETASPYASPHGMRVKRAIMGRRGTPATPVPSWKVFNNQLYDGVSMSRGKKQAPASARKLAATLWECQDLPLPAACMPACLYSPNWIPNSSQHGVSDSPLSQPDYVFMTPETYKSGYRRQQKTGVNGSLQRLLTKSHLEPGGMSSPVSITVDRQRHIPCPLFPTAAKGEVDAGLNVTNTMSKELVKVFNQIRLLEEQYNSSLRLTTALQAELTQAHARVKELELPNGMVRREAHREVEGLKKKFSDEKMSWKAKEKEKIKAAVQSVKEELQEERKAKQRLENANRKLTKELTEAQMGTTKALEELKNERKTRQLMEEVCKELTHEHGDDKAQVEEMKRQSQQVRENLEEERRMLQLAEVWREERVQMKLGEAKLALEEKSAALDVMRAELESFLSAQRHGSNTFNNTFRDAQVLYKVISAVHHNTSISTFPPASPISSTCSFPLTSEYMHDPTLSAESGQEAREHGHALLFYPEGIPDAD